MRKKRYYDVSSYEQAVQTNVTKSPHLNTLQWYLSGEISILIEEQYEQCGIRYEHNCSVEKSEKIFQNANILPSTVVIQKNETS